jgi:pimeloyl-ACP methyl ester carboxylesterase
MSGFAASLAAANRRQAASRGFSSSLTCHQFPGVSCQEIILQCSDGIHLAAQSWTKSASNDNPDPAAAGTKKRILCLHGWLDNCRSFHSVAPYLVQNLSTVDDSDYCHVVALDFPGHGWSSHKSQDGPPVLLADSAFYVAEAVRQLKWDRESYPFTLVGHSMGAAVGCLYAAAFPEQVHKLVLLEGAGPLSRKVADTARHLRQHVLRRQQGLETQKPPKIYPDLTTAVEMRQRTATNFPGNQYISSEAARELVLRGSRFVSSDDGGLQFCHDPRLYWPSQQYFTDEQTDAVYQDIQCPTALLLAVDGWPFDEARMQKTLELLQPVVYTTLPGSHHFHADPESMESVAIQVVEFLREFK